MGRVFVLAFAVLITLAPRLAAAQNPPPKVIEFPVQIAGAAGTLVEFYLNNGKRGDLALDASGIGDFVLNMGNSGKARLTLYVDVCRDGKIVKVMFAEGEPPPQEDDCNRRMLAAGFYNDCGITRVTIDVSKLLGRVIGCSNLLSNKKFIGTVGGVLIGAVALTAGGGGSTTSTASSTPTGVSSTPTPPAAPPAASPALPPSVSLPPVPPTNSTVDKNTNLACDACAPSSDTARHDPTLRLCSGLTGTFNAIVGSLTIRHPAPFIEVSGPNFNPQTGAFDLTGRGSIAGFNNVTVRAVGTMDPSTGRITMSYTMGTAGEFPGGQPITYAITLRKQ